MGNHEGLQQVNGHDKRHHRSAESIKQQVKTAARNRRKAMKEGRSYGHSHPKGNKLNARRAAYKPRSAARRGAAIGDAVVYLRHALGRAVRLGPSGYPVLGLLSLALESLGAEE
jgi:hypothetical protein